MGLDVSYYSAAKFERDNSDADYDGYDDDFVRTYVNKDFPGRADDIVTGWYSTGDGDCLPSMGYGEYNAWREELAKLAGWAPGSYHEYGRDWPSHAASAWAATEGPFWELILFTDCDGIIGPKTSAKLAKDFADHQGKADAHSDEDFRQKYSLFRTAFETASHGGLVSFH